MMTRLRATSKAIYSGAKVTPSQRHVSAVTHLL
jgi:hypothetical protein